MWFIKNQAERNNGQPAPKKRVESRGGVSDIEYLNSIPSDSHLLTEEIKKHNKAELIKSEIWFRNKGKTKKLDSSRYWAIICYYYEFIR